MAESTSLVRLRDSTVERLRQYADECQLRGVAIRVGDGGLWDGKISTDAVVRRLLALVDRHRARARKASKGRRKTRKGDGPPVLVE